MSDPVVEIHEVLHLAPLDHLHGGHLDLPVPGARSDVYGFSLSGWVLGKSAPADRVEVLLRGGRSILKVPFTEGRPDIEDAFPGLSEGRPPGFRANVGVLDLPREFEIPVRTILASGQRAPLARIYGSRLPLEVEAEGVMQPLLVSTIGRSGSTWLLWLLSRHPAIAAFRPFDTDARVATYWMSVLQDLSQPKSYVQQLNPDDVRAEAWWLGSGSTATRSVMDPELAGWLGRGAVEELAAVCRSRIDAFYSHAAVPGTRFFVEKVHPGRSIPELVTELYEGTREIILVRDFRDILCSITAFDEKRGFRAFGRESASSDEEYVVSSLRPSAEALVHRRDHAGSRALVVRYEELVTDPGGTITRLLSDLGVEHDGETVDRMVAATEPTSVLDHHQTSPSAESSIGRWQRDLSPDLADLCDAELGWALREFGYETSLEGSRAMLTS